MARVNQANLLVDISSRSFLNDLNLVERPQQFHEYVAHHGDENRNKTQNRIFTQTKYLHQLRQVVRNRTYCWNALLLKFELKTFLIF